MTPQEQQLIDGLIDRIRNTPVQDKDGQAEQHIQQGLAGTPDALYVLVQTVLVQQYGLQQAQAQLNELKQHVQALQSGAGQQKSSSGSFLSHIFGGGSSPAPQGNTGYQPVNNPGYGMQTQGGYPPPPPPSVYPSQGYPGYSTGGGMFGSADGGGGFLQGALQTAAGVAAGEMVFQGMEDLFHGFGHEGGRGFGDTGGGETVVNNYYDDDRDSGTGREDRGDSGFYDPSSDASRQDFASSDGGTDNFSGNDLGDSTQDDLGMDSGNFDDGSSDLS